ncbi:hypothetical protein A2188_01670 [Candidatus Woesebacteria bacterium RIFOXYA1_FULL_43_9]|uniref:HTH arsR-type domain-containing protein n=1 Tax=Candidatus Woesebacteria bacterium RIFOXYA1_FULL_43_9 TaxID=1802534 RepID=A0A1F8CKE9_9BACT|nr:MAG: hypothetical protein A2188_01670 [Candidatus Woesebacteria bacterium RIFOXYA1_FULL_43_9]
MASLSDLITSRVRVKVLELFFKNIGEKYHVRGVVREVDEEINAVRIELDRFEKAGILGKENRGNRVYYSIREDYEFFTDLVSLVAKTTGLGAEILQSKKKIGSLSFIMFSGRFARYLPKKNDDEVDILIIGDANMTVLSDIVRAEESRRGSEINYTVMTRQEYDFRKRRRDPFLQGILLGTRVVILGDDYSLIQ